MNEHEAQWERERARWRAIDAQLEREFTDRIAALSALYGLDLELEVQGKSERRYRLGRRNPGGELKPLDSTFRSPKVFREHLAVMRELGLEVAYKNGMSRQQFETRYALHKYRLEKKHEIELKSEEEKTK